MVGGLTVGGFKVHKISLKCPTYSETSDKGHSEREKTSIPTKDKLKVLTCIHTLPLKEDKGQNGWSRRCSLLRGSTVAQGAFNICGFR